jgi:Glycosyltransferase family 87
LSADSQNRIVNRYLWIYALLLVAMTASSWAVYLASGRVELFRPLFDRADRFRDLTNYSDKIAHLADGGAALGSGLPVYNYPAPAAYVYAFFLRGFPHHSVHVFLALLLAGSLLGAFLLWKAAHLRGARVSGLTAAIAATVVCGSPMAFAADRGNLEGVVGLILGTGLVLYFAERYFGAAVFIGLAASIKPFPGLFFFLLLRKKRYREVAVGFAVAACSTLLALTALGPTPIKAYQGLEPGVSRYYNKYIMTLLPPDERRFDHSVMGGIKSIAHTWMRVSDSRRSGSLKDLSSKSFALPSQPMPVQASPQPAGASPVTRSLSYEQMRAILLASLFLAAGALVFVLRHLYKLPAVNQMILLAVAATLLPPVSGEYTLVHLYVPFGAFLIFLTRDAAAVHVEIKQSVVLTILTLFALLFCPLTFFNIFSGDVKMCLLIAMLIVVSKNPMPSSIFKEIEHPQLVKLTN